MWNRRTFMTNMLDISAVHNSIHISSLLNTDCNPHKYRCINILFYINHCCTRIVILSRCSINWILHNHLVHSLLSNKAICVYFPWPFRFIYSWSWPLESGPEWSRNTRPWSTDTRLNIQNILNGKYHPSYELLGVTVSNSLRWGYHIHIAVQCTAKASKCLWFLKKLKQAGVSQSDLVYYHEAAVRPAQSGTPVECTWSSPAASFIVKSLRAVNTVKTVVFFTWSASTPGL